MPKSTYFNLPDDKRNLILEVSIDEFNEYGFENASISRIVDKAGIAKGSFYQYYEDKKDLFKYIIEIVNVNKVKYLGDIQAKAVDLDFFELLCELYRGALQFLRDNPKLASINDSFIKIADNKFRKEILGAGIEKSDEFLKDLLLKKIQDGEIDPEIDLDFITYMLTSVSISLGDYCRKKYVDLNQLEENDYYKLVDQTVKMLKQGIGSNLKSKSHIYLK
ncbi:TetR/AcrR family transcriptional regulator [Sedimentibacter sp.]|uniref:TetR/AcrR family transcriptional regulator n=1 Tax=Sedimentibacter sp. TaxID=1960295 RepID=UPI0028A6AF12|nr:TetR/AcrR family transcriptional regulator [Sedimentibacter sp.]